MKKFNIKDDIKIATTLHSDYYTDDSIFKESLEKIFLSSWQFFGHKDEIKNDISPFTFMPGLLSEPLMLTKDKGEIHCISNVCTHRGHIVCSKPQNTKLLTCRYHGRTFNLNGTLNNAPGFDKAEKFPSKEDNLKKINTKKWMNFIFISLNKAININPVLKDIESRVNSFPFDKLSFSEPLSSEFEINAHWAIYCENYLEGFHVPFVHKGLSKEIDNSSYETVLLKNGVVQFAKSNQENNIYGYYYWIFPNIMLNFYDWGLSVNIIEPISKDKTRIRFSSYPIKDNKQSERAVSDLIRVEMEDQSVVKSVHKGISSKFYTKGRYSPEHEKGVHYFHRLLSKYL